MANAIKALWLILGLAVFGASAGCNVADRNGSGGHSPKTETGIQRAADRGQLVGTWTQPVPGVEHEAQGFTLYADGAAESVNMATLRYTGWRVVGNKLHLTATSIGNRTSDTGTEEYTISFLDDHTLIIAAGDFEQTFKRSTQDISEGQAVSHPANGSLRPDHPITEHTWLWEKSSYNDDTEVFPKDPGAFRISFWQGNTLKAETDCNKLSAPYTLDGNKIDIGGFVSTFMYCEGSQEAEFAKMLSEVRTFLFTKGGKLVLEFDYDSGSMIFSPLPIASSLP